MGGGNKVAGTAAVPFAAGNLTVPYDDVFWF